VFAHLHQLLKVGVYCDALEASTSSREQSVCQHLKVSAARC